MKNAFFTMQSFKQRMNKEAASNRKNMHQFKNLGKGAVLKRTPDGIGVIMETISEPPKKKKPKKRR